MQPSRTSSNLPALRMLDCVRTAPANSRTMAIEAYWTARQIAAQQQSLVEQVRWLEALGPALTAENPPSPMGMLKLRTARLATEADRVEAEADGMAAQCELAGLARLATEKTQLVSLPFVGRLPLPAARSDHSWSLRRLEATLPQREQAISDQTAAVLEADASRAAATADFLAGRSSLDRVLARIEVQARETSAFLRGVTEYNRAIAQYVTIMLPTNIEVEKLVAALMVE